MIQLTQPQLRFQKARFQSFIWSIRAERKDVLLRTQVQIHGIQIDARDNVNDTSWSIISSNPTNNWCMHGNILMDLEEHKASEADKTWIANFGDSIRTVSKSQPVCMSITARLFQGQVQACQPNFDLHESPFWWLIYDVFLCFCALPILYLCLFYCD